VVCCVVHRLHEQCGDPGAPKLLRELGLAEAIPSIPQELSTAAGVVSRDVNSGRPGRVIGILAILIVVGFRAEWLIRRALARV
jgi:moderate conductance mechanosensitive channel